MGLAVGRVVASAPGKLILFGEHFVVKGYRAIATSVNLRARVDVEETSGSWVEFHSPTLNLKSRVSLDLGGFHGEFEVYVEILRALRREGYSIVPHRVVLESEMPVASGLGSSAATSVAYALAYTALLGDPLGRDELLRISFEGERVAHGRPSGIDNTIATLGGTVVYRRGDKPTPVNAVIPEDYTFIVADTGLKRSTRDVVEHVLKVAEMLGEAGEYVYLAADRIVEKALKALETGDMRLLGNLMYVNHGLLVAMGASNLALDTLVNIARVKGALGAKLTGAGWGGCMVVLAERGKAKAVVEELERHARMVRTVDIHVPGALIETL